MFDKAKEKLKHFEQVLWNQSSNLGFGKWFLIRLIQVTYLVILKIPKERPMLRAAALTYTSTLSLLPMMAMIFGLLGFFANKEAKEDAINMMFDRFQEFVIVEPVEQSTNENNTKINVIKEIKKNNSEEPQVNVGLDVEKLNKIKAQTLAAINGVSSGKISGVALVLFLMGALTLLANIERAFNDIWGIEKLRPFMYRMMSYVFILISSAIVLALTFTMVIANKAHLNNFEWFSQVPWIGDFLQSGFDVVLTCLITSVFFTVLYLVMPNVQVKLPSALAGGLVAGVFFESNKLIAVLLAGKFTTINIAFGSMAIIPIFLIGCMVVWMIVLLGAHVASAWGNVEAYRREFLSNRQEKGYDETIALRLMLAIAELFKKEGASTDYETLGESWAIPNPKLRNILGKLENCGLVHHLGAKETLYVPGRELGKISVVDILSAVRFGAEGWQPIPESKDSLRVNQLITKIHDTEEQHLKSMTLDVLLKEES